MRKRIVVFLILLTMLLPFVLTGCGSEKEDAEFVLPETKNLTPFEFTGAKPSHLRDMLHKDDGTVTQAEYKFVEENNDYILYFNTDRLDIALCKKGQNGQQDEFWYSNPTDDVISQGGGLSGEMKSQLQMLVLDKKKQAQSPNKTTYADCVAKQPENLEKEQPQYYITKTEDGHLKVIYIIGQLQKNYIIPTIISKAYVDDMIKAYKDKGVSSVGMNISNNYKVITYEEWNSGKLTEKKKQDYINTVPSLAEIDESWEPAYILTNDKIYNSEYLATQIQGYFVDYGYTEQMRDEDNQKNGVEARVPNVYWLPLSYSLEDDGLKVTMKDDEIVYNTSRYDIYNIEVMKYFGAGTQQEDGYLVIPDGPGAMIKFNNGKVQQKDPVRITMYGNDMGNIDPMAAQTKQGYLPVWGIKKQNSSLFTIIEDGSAISTVIADVSRTSGSTINPVNYVYSQYRLVDYDEMELFGEGYKLRAYQLNRSTCDIVLKYTVLSGEKHEYSDMAAYYRDYLMKRNVLKDQTASANIPFNLELEGGIEDYSAFMGISYSYISSLTSFDDAQLILDELLSKGVKNINVKYRGWANNGMANQIFDRVNVLSELGGKKGFNDLMAYAKEKGITIYPETELLVVYEDKLLDSFNSHNDVSRKISRDNAILMQYDLMTLSQWRRGALVLRPKTLKAASEKLLESLQKMNLDTVDLGTIGYILNGDYNIKAVYDRSMIQTLYNEIIANYSNAGIKLAADGGNVYMLPGTTAMFNLPNLSSEYYVTDATIPFYQMVIHGMIPYSGEAINQSGDPKTSLLNAVEFGAGLFYRWMYQENSAMKDIYFEDLYSLYYGAWINDATVDYTRYNNELGHTAALKMVDHERLTDMLAMTVYEDGTTVYVNYGEEDATYNNVVIKAKDYKVIKGVA